jgi:hypothetical protein
MVDRYFQLARLNSATDRAGTVDKHRATIERRRCFRYVRFSLGHRPTPLVETTALPGDPTIERGRLLYALLLPFRALKDRECLAEFLGCDLERCPLNCGVGQCVLAVCAIACQSIERLTRTPYVAEDKACSGCPFLAHGLPPRRS